VHRNKKKVRKCAESVTTTERTSGSFCLDLSVYEKT